MKVIEGWGIGTADAAKSEDWRCLLVLPDRF